MSEIKFSVFQRSRITRSQKKIKFNGTSHVSERRHLKESDKKSEHNFERKLNPYGRF